MNKTVKKIVSLLVVMTFMLTIAAVPVSFAAIDATPTATYGWKVELFADLNADGTGKTPITALAPNQEAYVQFVLTGIKYLRTAQATLTPVNATFVATDANATSKAAFENFKTSAAIVGTNILELNGTFTSFAADAATFAIGNPPMNENFPIEDGVYGTTNTTEGTDVVLMTYKIKAAADVSAEKKVAVTVSDTEFLIGELKRGAHTATDVPAANQKNLTDVTLPTVSSATLVNGNTDAATTVEKITTTDGKDPLGADASYYFRAVLTNGTTKYYKLNNKVKEASDGAGAYITNGGTAINFALTPGQDGKKQNETRTANFTISDPALSADYAVTTAVNFEILATQYRVKENAPAIELPRGIATLKDETKAKIIALLEKSADGNTWVSVVADDVAATEATFTTQAGEAFTNMAAVNTPTADLKLVVGDMTFTGDNKVTVKTIAPISKPTPELALKAGQEFTVYKSAMPETFAEEVIVEETLSDDETKVETKTKDYTVTGWADYVAAETEDMENDGQPTDLTIAFTNTAITGGTIKVTAKAATALDEYRVKADQSFTINKYGKVDTSAIKFEQLIQKVKDDPSTNAWVDYTPAGAITLSKFDNTKDGTNTVTVSVAGIELDPATITVKVEVKPVYSAAWGTEAAPKLAVGAAPEDIIDMLLFTADYSGVQEAVELTDVTLTGYDPAATGEQTVKVMHDGKEIGSLTITLVADASNAKADLPVAGVELVGKLTTVIEVEAGKVDLTVAANSGNNIKLLATVTGVDAAKDYPTTVEFPGFAPVDVTIKVAADGKATVELDPGAKLIAGYVAKANGDTAAKADINDNDFYAIAASFGAAPNGAKAKYDLNRDGKIDELDIQAVLGNLGTELTK